VNAPARYAIQALLYVAFGAALGYFSSYPTFEVMPADQALVRLSFSHGAKPSAPCRERTDEELAKLAPNMRAAMDCPRERSPLVVELELDGNVVLRREVEPAGLKRDGNATVYHRLPVPAGKHRIAVRMRDRPGEGFNFTREETVDLAPGRVLLIDFIASQGGFQFRS
jgi:hypothetical protein